MPICFLVLFYRNMIVSVVIPTYNRHDKLLDCVKSIENSIYKDFEIIIVDNSEDGNVVDVIWKIKFNNIRVIYNYQNLWASWARTIWALNAKWDRVLFVDDDNILDSSCIYNLVKVVKEYDKIGALSPIMYHLELPTKLRFSWAFFNFYTSKATFLNYVKDQDFYECDMIHNVYMIKKDIWDLCGWQDSDLFMGYEEFDLLMKIHRLWYKIWIAKNAVDYHDHPVKESILRLINTPEKAYHTIKNRMIIMKRYSNCFQLTLFVSVFYPFFVLAYAYFIIRQRKFSLLIPHFRGALAGYFYLFR